MNFNQYQQFTRTTDVGTSAQDCLQPGWLYYLLGLVGETGEITEKFKKLFRDKRGVVNSDFKLMLSEELGDVLWYMARLSDHFGIGLEDIALINQAKLRSRQERGKLHGDGDKR